MGRDAPNTGNLLPQCGVVSYPLVAVNVCLCRCKDNQKLNLPNVSSIDLFSSSNSCSIFLRFALLKKP